MYSDPPCSRSGRLLHRKILRVRCAEEGQEQGSGSRRLHDDARHLLPAQGEEEMEVMMVWAVSAGVSMREPRSAGGASDG